jgi:release factor glutamine methyltransferase
LQKIFNRKLENPAQYIQNELKRFFSTSEISILTRLILSEVCHLSFTEVTSSKGSHFSDAQRQKIEDIVSRLQKNEPIQYIIGVTEFYGLSFRTTPDVLIPRPETEELVEWILLENAECEGVSILDIGTGSGCIPVVLAKKMSGAIVSAWDISEKAIAIAIENAQQNDVNVHFVQQDVFAPFSLETTFDIIVSNPPYVLEAEKETMSENVLDFEPHIALFVPNDNPLLFYERIADIAIKHLASKGKLYLEINREKGDAVATILQQKGFAGIELRNDISGNERMIRAIKSERK